MVSAAIAIVAKLLPEILEWLEASLRASAETGAIIEVESIIA